MAAFWRSIAGGCGTLFADLAEEPVEPSLVSASSCVRRPAATGREGVMSDPTSETVRLSDDDIAFLLMILRNSNRPLTTAQLVDALREQSLLAPRD